MRKKKGGKGWWRHLWATLSHFCLKHFFEPCWVIAISLFFTPAECHCFSSFCRPPLFLQIHNTCTLPPHPNQLNRLCLSARATARSCNVSLAFSMIGLSWSDVSSLSTVWRLPQGCLGLGD